MIPHLVLRDGHYGGGGGGGVTPQGVFSDTIKIAMGEPPHTKNFKMATKWGEMMQIY